jgi:hypothetical protein
LFSEIVAATFRSLSAEDAKSAASDTARLHNFRLDSRFFLNPARPPVNAIFGRISIVADNRANRQVLLEGPIFAGSYARKEPDSCGHVGRVSAGN